MKLDKLKSVLGAVAPTLAAALIPGGAVLAPAIATISKALLGKPDAAMDEVEAAVLGATPEALAKLREIDNAFKIEMGRQGIQLIEIEHKNTADARAMQVAALAQDDAFAKRFVYYFAAGWSIFAALYLTAITFLALPESSVRFADTAQGFILGTLVATILNFFFGSSYSSRQKDATVAALSKH